MLLGSDDTSCSKVRMGTCPPSAGESGLKGIFINATGPSFQCPALATCKCTTHIPHRTGCDEALNRCAFGSKLERY